MTTSEPPRATAMTQPPQLVRVCEPELVSDGLASSHHTYLVELTGDGVICGSARRRFSDFDLLARQLLQQEGAGLVLLSLERAMNAGSEIAMLVAGSLLRSTDEFGWLVAGSAAATAMSTVLLTVASSGTVLAKMGRDQMPEKETKTKQA